MAAPKGNQNAKGHAGGPGRPSMKETQEHLEKWTFEHDVQELEAKIATKKYSPWDVYRLRALKADQTILKNWADKVLADLHMVKSKVDMEVEVTDPVLDSVRLKYEKELRERLEGNA